MKTAVVLLYVLIASSFILHAMKMKSKKLDKIGTYPIDKRVFVFGKIAMFTSWLFPLASLFVDVSIVSAPGGVKVFALLLITGGILIFSTSFFHLGPEALKFGIPGEEDATELKTGGLFRFSRNPIYVGFFMMIAGSCIFAPNPVNWLFGIVAIAIHHFIVLSEERFLDGRFGDEWRLYKGCVRRYI